jgi:hypothetical protein
MINRETVFSHGRGGRNEIGSRGFKSQALPPKMRQDASRQGEPVQKGQSTEIRHHKNRV